MTTAFVVLAAGKGTRSRAGIHKALLPVGGEAMLSRLFGLAPEGARLMVVTGHAGNQLRDFVRLAHPRLGVEFVDVEGWDAPGAGPGASLLAAATAVGSNDLVFVTCDTMWAPDPSIWAVTGSWAAVAPIPAGSADGRWCRLTAAGDVLDKEPGADGFAWTGLARIAAADLPAFWAGIEGSGMVDGERQISGGLAAIPDLGLVKVEWTDVGDEASYVAAVGYDNSKPGETTLIGDRVVKVWADPEIAENRAMRATMLAGVVPRVEWAPSMIAYEFVPGVTAYEAVEDDPDVIDRLLEWADSGMWRPIDTDGHTASIAFYREKTFRRVRLLRDRLREQADAAIIGIDWNDLASRCEPCLFHGDFNLSNIIVKPDGTFVAVDWRQGFAGRLWGDRRYDVAKLAASCRVRWDWARAGVFDEWDGSHIAARLPLTPDIELIGALSLLNSAPLHAAPLDAVLVERAIEWLGELR